MRQLRLAVAAAAALWLLVGCSSGDASGSTDSSKYTQTWSKDYSATSCKDWNDRMTDHQQFAAAADMLSAARDKRDGGSGVAPDDLIEQFQTDVTAVCTTNVGSREDIAEVGASVYLSGRSHYRP